jgi:RNA methyltransferase, TrmH family
MLSKNLAKYIQSLHQKKSRQENQSFLVEGAKSVEEVLKSDFEIELLLTTDQFYKENTNLLDNQPVTFATEEQLAKVGTLQSNNTCLAVVKTKENQQLLADAEEIVLVLDDIRDPGNLGTIIRIADWYGIKKIVCSDSTTELYNPKVIAASKGSFTRVSVYYTDLVVYLENIKQPLCYGAFLDGKDVHHVRFDRVGGYLIMGNESNGISKEVEVFVKERLTIPRYGQAESLNAAIATAIMLDNLFKN